MLLAERTFYCKTFFARYVNKLYTILQLGAACKKFTYSKGNGVLLCVFETQDLGVIIYYKLKFDSHINENRH